jgi:hypothetical protein
MIRFLVRSLGLWLMAGGFAAAVVDGMKSIAASRPILTPVGSFWNDLMPASLLRFRTLIETGVGDWVWSGVIAPCLAVVPVFAAAVVVGVVLVAIGRPPRPKIGVEP